MVGRLKPTRATLRRTYLASDGVWDLWEYDEVSEKLVPPGRSPSEMDAASGEIEARAAALIEETRARGNNFYGENADNLTGVLVKLLPPPPPKSPMRQPLQQLQMSPGSPSS